VFREQLSHLLFGFLQEHGLELLYKALGALGIFLAWYLAIKAVVKKIKQRVLDNTLVNDDYTKKMARLLGNMIFVSLMVFNVLAFFGFLGMDVWLIIGALSIAIGFALETTIKNMISGIFLLTNKKNKLGDTVEILGKFQLRGRIESITLRHTTIRTKDNRRVLIPNGELADTPIKTFKNETIMRGLLQVRVPRHSNIDQVRQLIIQTINANDFVQDKNYTTALISNFDAYGIVIKSFYYLNPSAGKTDFVINSEIRTQLSKLFKKYGIQTPYLNVVVDVD